jgi:hypothetical protein
VLIVKAAIAIALVLAGAWLARRSRAALRHALLTASFGVLLVLPIVSAIAPAVRIGAPVVPLRETALLVDAISVAASAAERSDPPLILAPFRQSQRVQAVQPLPIETRKDGTTKQLVRSETLAVPGYRIAQVRKDQIH